MSFINICDYGAQSGSISTAAVQAAFDAAAAVNGTVLVPKGVYLTGTVNMGGASLYLEKGACLKGSRDMADYRSIGYNHNEMGDVRSLLYAADAAGFTISGEGCIDLSGDAFYDFDHREIPPSKIPFTRGQTAECTAKWKERPNQPICFLRCENVTLKDIVIQNAPCWTLSFIECTHVHITDITVDNDLRIPNNDGMHFCSCTDVIIRGCIISTGDDCIALSGITNWEKPCERVLISDCSLRSCSKAIAIGFAHSIIRDVTINNCVIRESNRALVVMACAGSGLIENIIVSNMRLDTRIQAGNWWGNGEPVCIMGTYHNLESFRDPRPDRKYTVSIRNIFFQNLVCSGENVIAVIGENKSVQGVSFDTVRFELKDSENLPLKGRMVDLAPGKQNAVLPDNGVPYWFFAKDVRDLRLTHVSAAPYHGKTPAAFYENVEDIR